VRYFDFESDISGPTHVPNYAVVTPDGVDFTLYDCGGASVMDAFCAGELCRAHEGTTFVAHNAKGYDAQFIKAWLIRMGIQFEFTPNGCKIMEVSHHGRCVTHTCPVI
jgi:hypothetical protein